MVGIICSDNKYNSDDMKMQKVDAFIASVDFMWRRAAFGVSYDFSQGDMKTLGVAKNAVELGLRYNLKK